jgi:hypothetical protein
VTELVGRRGASAANLGRRTTRPASANVPWYQRIGRGSVNV